MLQYIEYKTLTLIALLSYIRIEAYRLAYFMTVVTNKDISSE